MRINQENKTLDMEIRDVNFILPPYVRSYLFYSKNEMPTKIVFPMFAAVDILGADGQLHPLPIEWIAPESPVAKEIAKDGEVVAEVTPEQEAILDKQDESVKELKAEFEPAPEGEKVEGLTEEEQTYEAARADQPTPAPEDLIRQQEEDALAEQEAAMAAEAEAEAKAAAEHIESPAKAAFAESPATPPPTPERQPKQPPGGDIGPGQPLSGMGPRGSGDQIQTARDLKDEPDIKEEEQVPFEKEIGRDEAGKPIVEDKPDATG
ncbi:MAG: hypothetical protein KAY32_15430 [Candidatus Eisenbacteria sp.]|nr:hypothetical protein [Candidatus Eisenbacteria bacterium]